MGIMKSFRKSEDGFIGVVPGLLIAIGVILAMLVLLHLATNLPIPKAKKAENGLRVYKPATVRNLVTEFATYSDGDGIKIFGKAILFEGVDAKNFFPDLKDANQYAVYRMKDPQNSNFDVLLLSKRTLQGNVIEEFSCVLRKFSRNDKYLVDTKSPEVP